MLLPFTQYSFMICAMVDQVKFFAVEQGSNHQPKLGHTKRRLNLNSPWNESFDMCYQVRMQFKLVAGQADIQP